MSNRYESGRPVTCSGEEVTTPQVYFTDMDANEPVETSAPEPRRFVEGLTESLDLTRSHPDKPIGALPDGF